MKKFRAGAVSKRVKLDGPSGFVIVNDDLTGTNLTHSLLTATLISLNFFKDERVTFEILVLICASVIRFKTMAGTVMNLPREGQNMISPRQKHERQRGV
jgi:hypothetical protein